MNSIMIYVWISYSVNPGVMLMRRLTLNFFFSGTGLFGLARMYCTVFFAFPSLLTEFNILHSIKI